MFVNMRCKIHSLYKVEEEIRETHGKEQSEEQSQRTNTQAHDMDDHVDDMMRSCRHLGLCVVQHIIKHVRCE